MTAAQSITDPAPKVGTRNRSQNMNTTQTVMAAALAAATAIRVAQNGVAPAAGQLVFALGNAGALTDANLPPGHYHVVTDFGRVKRMGDVEAGRLATLYLHGSGEPG